MGTPILCILILFISLSSAIKVDTSNTLFIDQYNRYVVYHGVNVVFKTEPFYPELQYFSSNFSLTDMDLQNLKQWGFNMIRLHVAWEGAEPEKGEYNYTYIQKLRQIVRMCDKHGIYVLLDAHQDLFSKKFCGQGFPDWAVTHHNFPFPVTKDMKFDEKGYPIRDYCLKKQFALFYLSQDVMRFQEDFFGNKNGIFDHFIGMWKRVAAYMSKQPNLIGYQIVNEPIGANIYKNPSDVLLPGASNNKQLRPAYEKAYQAIREVDPINLIFYEPSILDPIGGGFYETLGDQKQKQRQVFSYHIYCPYVTKEGEPVQPQFCKTFDQLQVASKQLNTQHMKVGAFLTEYGALSDSEKSAGQITVITDLMNEYFRSWSYWQFKYYNDITTAARPGTTQSFYDVDGNLQQNKVRALSRPYAYAICGTPVLQKFQKGSYTFKWRPNKDCYNKNTEIYLSQSFHFPLGFNHKFQNCQKCQMKKISQTNFYELIVPNKSEKKIGLYIQPIKSNKKEDLIM